MAHNYHGPSREAVMETMQQVITLLSNAARIAGLNTDQIRSFYEEQGLHHDLLEIAYPEEADSENPDYAALLDEFEGNLLEWIGEDR